MSDDKINHRNRTVKLKEGVLLLQPPGKTRVKMSPYSGEQHMGEVPEYKATVHARDREVVLSFVAGNSLDVFNRQAVHLEYIDPHVRKRELNWYVKVEERKP